MKTDVYDIAIIGAGPAGCACALALQGSGLRVVLLDKETFPRDKVCGDAIPGSAFKAMDRINREWAKLMRQFLNKEDVTSAKAYTPNGKSVKYNWVTYSYNSKRLNFDNFLLQLVRSKTETTILENKRLQQVISEGEVVTCKFIDESSLTAAIVIGCDGANSVVTRQLGKFDLRGDNTGLAVRAYVRGIEGIQKGVNEFYFLKEFQPGYFWIFPLEDGFANVGFGLFPEKAGKNKTPVNLRDAFTKITKTSPSIAPRFQHTVFIDDVKGFALPLGTQPRPISGNRFMLCGDAAALIDPFGGHGIDNAMWSGLMAAQQAIRCFQSVNFTAAYMLQYDKAVYQKMGSKFSRGMLVMKLMKRFPWIVNMVTSIAQHQALAKWVVRIFKI
jgi:geranylgeranyl reductase family protein